MSVEVDELATAINEALTDYSEEVTEGIKKAVDKVARETRDEIKSNVTFKGTGQYLKSFRLKTTYESRYAKEKTWYVRAPHYRLTHLLEKGHEKSNHKGKTRAFPHIEYGEKLAQRRMEELAKEVIGGDG